MLDGKYHHTALQIGWALLRVGYGIFFLAHGIPKLFGGMETWTPLGQAMGALGITFAPAFWGFCAAVAEAGGGLLLILGLFVRPAAAMMLATMLVAAWMHIAKGEGFRGYSHAAEAAVVFLALLIGGPGRFGLVQVFKTCPVCRKLTGQESGAATTADEDERPTRTGAAPPPPAAPAGGG